MDDSFSLWALYAVSIYMGHHVMAYLFFSGFGHVIVNIVCMSFQLIDLFLGNIQSQFFLCLCQSDPQSSPGTEFHIRRKNILHFFAGITLGQWTYISVCTHTLYLSAFFFKTSCIIYHQRKKHNTPP